MLKLKLSNRNTITSGADLLPLLGRGSMMTSVKLRARSSVELLEDTAS